jgi:DNA-binding SARP family transcriptional activator/tetratricopeptide (TPR) repeat protein
MEFRILGPLEVVDGGAPVILGARKQRALLAILVLHRNEVVSTERLVDELWGDAPPKTARKTLQLHVSHLRRSLPSAVLETQPPGYVLRVEPEELDLGRFERLVEQARTETPAAAAGLLREALALWRGPPLGDLEYEPFARGEIARLEELRLTALEDRIDAEHALGRHADSVGELESLVLAHPLRERMRGQLMLALYRSGRQVEALETYREGRGALVAELGIEPGRELRELEQAIIQQQPSLEPVEVAAPDIAAPAPHGGVGFVGRERELAELDAAFAEALDGQGGLVLVAGEPGIGKSRLLAEFGRHAGRRGARVLAGRCWEAGGAPAYWPWVQSLRPYLRATDQEALRTELGSEAAVIAQLLPELRELVPDLPPSPAGGFEGARFRLFDATATFLRRMAETTPLVLALDDFHSADTPSLLLLRFLAEQVADSRILIVGAYRDVELAPEHPLRSTLAELQRHAATRRLPLRGLAEPDVARLVASTPGVGAADPLAATIYDQTDGNPLFVEEVVKLLAAEGRSTAIPETVREVIGRRLAQLPDPCTELLMRAAVIGREFSLATLGRVAEPGRGEVLETLDPAIGAHVVEEVTGARGRLRFSHGLVRDALYEDLPPGRRARTHRRIGEVLEPVDAGRPQRVAELSHHFYEGAQSGGADKALHYLRLAGDRALSTLAYEEADRLYRNALEVIELVEPVDERARCDLLLALGETRMRAGDGPRAKESFWQAAELARFEQLPDRLARAALGYGGRFVWSRAGSDEHVVPLLEEALDGVGARDSEVRARLLARLAGAMRDAPSRERAAAVSREAVEVARRVGDPATLAYALDGRHVAIWGPDTAEERAAIVEELARLTKDAGDDERSFQGQFWGLEAMLEAGDVAGATAGLADAARTAERLKQPAQRWYVAVTEALLALLEGRFVEAEDRIERALGLGQEAQSWEALAYYRVQLYALRSAQGRLAELEDAIRRSVVEYPHYAVFRCVLTSLLAEVGSTAEAAIMFEPLAADGFAALPRDEEWVFGLSLLAEVSDRLGDAPRSARLYELLAPFAGRNVLSVPDVAAGSVARTLGVLAAATGRWEAADAHFEEALAMNLRMGARPWAARTLHGRARMLVARGAPGDRARASEELRRAIDGYRALGMTAWAQRAAREPQPARIER